MLTLFLRSFGVVQLTMANYHSLLDITSGEEHERIERLIRKRFKITLPS